MKPELLIPAGSFETLKVALSYGADAIYCGGERFSLRKKANNFSLEELREGIKYTHNLGKKIYVTINIFPHNDDLIGLDDFLNTINQYKPDGLIIADVGVFSIAKNICKNIPLHISTQANIINYESANFWSNIGAKRVVLGRELSLIEIEKIKNNINNNLEIECFIHGSMCIAYSGRCLLSAFLTNKESNLGECTHPCRWNYSLVEEKRPGEYMNIEEDNRGTYIFNSKDLCMIEHIPDLIKLNIDSFKIEGRMKTALYIATVARTYRKAIDDYYNGNYEANLEWYKKEICKCTYRDYTTGFFYGKPDNTSQIYNNNTYKKGSIFYGIVEKIENEYAFLTQKNKFEINQELEIMKIDGTNVKTKVLEIYDLEKEEFVSSCKHSKQKIRLKLSIMPNVGEIIRS
ncbi:MAG: U32 family peptidase [Eubacteriales bacterium]|nr:U32 family peptidase [Eubacteriales bacterium]